MTLDEITIEAGKRFGISLASLVIGISSFEMYAKAEESAGKYMMVIGGVCIATILYEAYMICGLCEKLENRIDD